MKTIQGLIFTKSIISEGQNDHLMNVWQIH